MAAALETFRRAPAPYDTVLGYYRSVTSTYFRRLPWLNNTVSVKQKVDKTDFPM